MPDNVLADIKILHSNEEDIWKAKRDWCHKQTRIHMLSPGKSYCTRYINGAIADMSKELNPGGLLFSYDNVKKGKIAVETELYLKMESDLIRNSLFNGGPFKRAWFTAKMAWWARVRNFARPVEIARCVDNAETRRIMLKFLASQLNL